MSISDIINVVAILLAPIVSVVIGQKLQDRSKKRQDKMEIFKELMTSRVYGWTNSSVQALNIIDVVFAEDKKVREQWKKYYDSLCIGNPTEIDLKRIDIEKYKLLEIMAKSLGYKDKITWETIHNPYMPKGLCDSILQQQQYQNEQLEIAGILKALISNQNMNKTSSEKDDSRV